MQNGNNTLLLFKRYSPQKLLEKGKLFFILDTDGFERLNQDIATLDERIDALALIENGMDYSNSTVFILNRSKFESFFSFVDFYIEEINNNRIILANQQLVDKFVGYQTRLQILFSCLSKKRFLKGDLKLLIIIL